MYISEKGAKNFKISEYIISFSKEYHSLQKRILSTIRVAFFEND